MSLPTPRHLVVIAGLLATVSAPALPQVIFADGFESGDVLAWSNVVGELCIEALVVTPNGGAIHAGGMVTFTASAQFSNGSSADYSLHAGTTWSATPDPDGGAVFSGNVATTLLPGSVEIRATHASSDVCSEAPAGSVSHAVPLDITDPLLLDIDVTCLGTIPIDFFGQCVATAMWSNATETDVTELADWGSGNPFVVEVSDVAGSKGRTRGLDAGSASIAATFDTLSDFGLQTVSDCRLTSIVVLPSDPTRPIGFDVPFTANAVWTGADAATCVADVSHLVDWSSAHPAVASNGSDPTNRTFATVSTGTTDVVATYSPTGINGTTTLTVTADELVDVSVRDPASCLLDLPPGMACHLELLGTYSGAGLQRIVTAEALWDSDDETVAIMETPGTARGVTPGTTTFTARIGSIEDEGSLTVGDRCLDAIELDIPGHATGAEIAIPSNVPLRLVATGLFTDHSTFDVTSEATWDSSNPIVLPPPQAATSLTGPAGTASLGVSVDVPAACGAGTVSDDLDVEVTSLPLLGLAIEPLLAQFPVADELPLGWSAQYRAIGDFGAGGDWELTSRATWRSENFNVATLAEKGIVSTSETQSGQTVVRATIDGLFDTRVLDVVDEVLIAVIVDADPYAGYAAGDPIDWPEGSRALQLRATGLLSAAQPARTLPPPSATPSPGAATMRRPPWASTAASSSRRRTSPAPPSPPSRRRRPPGSAARST